MQVLARRRGYTLVEFLVVLGTVSMLGGLLGLMVWPVYSHNREQARRALCGKNLRDIGIAFQQYAQDYDGRFVPTTIGSRQNYGWADALHLYWEKQPKVLQCPAEATGEPGRISTERGYTDYWMNVRFSRVELKNVYSPAQSILSGDGNDGTDSTNARYNLPSLPPAWLKDKQSPAYRHLDTMNILFADGHVKAMKASATTTGAPNENTTATATFATNWRE